MKIQEDGLEAIIEHALAGMPEVGKWQQEFIKLLFETILLIQGKVNFSSLGNHSILSIKTFRRGFQRDFDFESFNLRCIEQRPVQGNLVAAIDASFIKKSGRQTQGLGYFFNGCVGKAMKGLEVSEIALIDCDTKQAYAFSTRQTVDSNNLSRMKLYAQHVKDNAGKFAGNVKYLLADGYYSKRSFVDEICALELDMVGKLRSDANLKYLYEGSHAGRGRPRKYDGKVNFQNLSRFHYEKTLEDTFHIYSQTVFHVQLKRIIRVVLIVNTSKKQPSYIVLFSTDCNLSGSEILTLYRLRFQIEFLFRDAKQFTGLADCQARNLKALHFHFNAAFSAVNLAKLDLQIRHQKQTQTQLFVFSLAAYIRKNFSQQLLKRFLSNLALDLTCPIINSAFDRSLNFGFSEY